MTQKTPVDLPDFIPYLLNLAAEETSLEFKEYYKSKFGLLRTEWRVIFHLGTYGDMLAKDICSRGNLHKTKVSRAVSALEKRRFLTRTQLLSDRRHEVLHLTRQGVCAFEDLQSAAGIYSRKLADKFGDEELDMLRVLLKSMIRMKGG